MYSATHSIRDNGRPRRGLLSFSAAQLPDEFSLMCSPLAQTLGLHRSQLTAVMAYCFRSSLFHEVSNLLR